MIYMNANDSLFMTFEYPAMNIPNSDVILKLRIIAWDEDGNPLVMNAEGSLYNPLEDRALDHPGARFTGITGGWKITYRGPNRYYWSGAGSDSADDPMAIP